MRDSSAISTSFFRLLTGWLIAGGLYLIGLTLLAKWLTLFVGAIFIAHCVSALLKPRDRKPDAAQALRIFNGG